MRWHTEPTSSSRRRGWLSERRRISASLAVAVITAAVLLAGKAWWGTVSVANGCVVALLAYTVTYLIATVTAFSSATSSAIHGWASREARGTVLQRYVLGTAPGPGVSLFFAAGALIVAMVWLPGRGGDTLPTGPRVGVAIALIVVAWLSVAVSYAVTFYADNLVEGGKALEFPGTGDAEPSDYLYFAISVMTTFGTTDVNVTSQKMRRTVTANAVIAFVFNTVTVAAAVSALS